MRNLIQSFARVIRWIGALFSAPAPQAGPHCTNINALLLHLCDFDHDLHIWVLRWLAYPLQNPGAKMSTCLLINGGQGTGKTLFFEAVVAQLYGTAGRVIPVDALHRHFNPWTRGASFVVVDGEYSKRSASQLKHLVASTSVCIDTKGKPAEVIRNEMNFVFLSGAMDFLPLEAQDRRFVVIEAPPAQDPLFYRAVAAEIHNGGAAAFLEYLLHGVEMNGFNEYTKPPVALSPFAQEAA